MPYLLLTCSALFWSGNFVLSRAMHAYIPPVGLAWWRWAAALLLFLPLALPHLKKQQELLRRHYKFLLIQGLLGITGFNTLIYLAVQTTTAINAVLVNSCIPVLMVVISWLMFREALTLRQGLGVLISLAGVLLLIAKGDVTALAALQFNRGDLLVLAAACVWALYSVNLKRFPKGLHPFAYLAAIMVCGLIFLTPFYLLELSSGQGFETNAASLLTIGYLALFASVLAFIFWNRGVREVGANKAGPFIHLMPVFSTLLATFFLHETLAAYHLRGMALVVLGITLTSLKSRG